MAKKDEKPDAFAALCKIMAPYKKKLSVVTDSDASLYLDTAHIMKNKKPLFFGSVSLKKNYVSFYLMPVYVEPSLLDGMSPELKKHMQGKSCFNFKAPDKALFKELAALTKAGFAYYADEGYV